jgi:plasmid stability protein
MVDILVRNIDDDTAARLKQKAKAAGKSVAETAREALVAYTTQDKAELWAEADRIRERIGKVSGDSTADIRADRDNDERYR